MRIAILADIHGNFTALKSVLKASSAYDIDTFLIAGDLVGYYFHPDKVLELLEPLNKKVIKGNHENELSLSMGSEEHLRNYEIKYGSGLRIAIDILSNKQLNYLISLPASLTFNINDRNILLCHGSPWDTDQYIYPDTNNKIMTKCVNTGFDLVIMGHTHYPMIKKFNNTVLLNPGSVGQARDRKPGACWAIYDSDNGEIQLKREHYDYMSVANEAKLLHPELPYLSKVLLRQ